QPPHHGAIARPGGGEGLGRQRNPAEVDDGSHVQILVCIDPSHDDRTHPGLGLHRPSSPGQAVSRDDSPPQPVDRTVTGPSARLSSGPTAGREGRPRRGGSQPTDNSGARQVVNRKCGSGRPGAPPTPASWRPSLCRLGRPETSPAILTVGMLALLVGTARGGEI